MLSQYIEVDSRAGVFGVHVFFPNSSFAFEIIPSYSTPHNSYEVTLCTNLHKIIWGVEIYIDISIFKRVLNSLHKCEWLGIWRRDQVCMLCCAAICLRKYHLFNIYRCIYQFWIKGYFWNKGSTGGGIFTNQYTGNHVQTNYPAQN